MGERQKTSHNTVSHVSMGSKGALRGSVPAGGTMDESGRTGTAPTLACTLPIPWSVGSAHCLNPGRALGMVTEIIRPCSHFLGGNRLFIPSVETKCAVDAGS